MRSSTGQHSLALDHIRALAAFLVFAWHFAHAGDPGYPVPFDAPSPWILAILDAGHTGVALFMTLSGYLFAKILEGRSFSYPIFLLNRALRLLPLLVLVIIVIGIRKYWIGADLDAYWNNILWGPLLPTLPNGGWSITVEAHFYLLLPLLLWLSARWRFALPLLLVATVGLRLGLYCAKGEVQFLAYWTLVGRIDQFVLGIIAARSQGWLMRHPVVIGGLIASLLAFYAVFDAVGGFALHPSHPSSSPLWIILPTFEGMVYAAAIAWYDRSGLAGKGLVSKGLARIGDYSYSLYLLHFFVVFRMADFIHRHIMDISTPRAALPWAVVCFALMIPLGYLSFRFIEAPFLSLRRSYIRPRLEKAYGASPS
ncbi:acyltransferase [Rhodospirillum rubrum]|nr:acyltransferase [Rhodospirillum rubrum]MBK1677217.1 acyltransferase [Rhodospirillum rubrum]